MLLWERDDPIHSCRALIAPIEMATGTQAYFCGKPNPLMMRTGLNMLGCHSAEAGIDPKVLQVIIGHADIGITMNIYNHTDSERMQGEMKKLENIM